MNFIIRSLRYFLKQMKRNSENMDTDVEVQLFIYLEFTYVINIRIVQMEVMKQTRLVLPIQVRELC